MSKKKNTGLVAKKNRKLSIYLIAIPLLIFLIKLIVMSKIQNGGWLGADGENYLTGVDGLLKDGLTSTENKLTYWPAGYPILLFLLTKLSLAHLILLLSVIQSAFYAYASYFFVKQLNNSQLKKLALTTAIILGFNPTLSLASLAVGYESPIASCMLMVVGLIIKSKLASEAKITWLPPVAVGGFLALATFMQPRWLLTSFVISLIWALTFASRKTQALIVLVVCGVMAIAPTLLIVRNIAAVNLAVISTNLGATMRLGAGDGASGGYSKEGSSIVCDPTPPSIAVSDNGVVKCVIKWYLSNPVKAVPLVFRKAIFYWSPWFGPVAKGTMARNPWLKINPLVNISKATQEGNNLVYGNFGKLVSWLWLLGGISLFFTGFFWLRSLGSIPRAIGHLSFWPVVISWAVTIGTIGDHRFRLPTLSLSLFLQVAGYFALRNRLKTHGFEPVLESKARTR